MRLKATGSPELAVEFKLSEAVPKVTPDAYVRVLDERLIVCGSWVTVSVTPVDAVV
jgi:hypothetical protein